ncbi:hypothetical protein EGW08_017120 [Elysia chlorotica]|uniref:GST C-terminal domain-containing protein n=1 Tax=Elysia chlorotica TaxID=188477 RepID=A0A3S0ZBJ8_ELYCH|nr:hypothetical protein EGW08_017120 [Elysia chlorotica]
MAQSMKPERPPPGPPDTLIVYGVSSDPDMPSLSPYVLKLEVYLKLAKVPYVLSERIAFSSKGKVPWMSYNGEEIADSHFCIDFVKSKFGADLNKGLSAEQLAVSHAFRIMMDEFHFWLNVHFRLYDPDDPIIVRLDPTAPGRRAFKERYDGYMNAQGVGRHSEGQITRLFVDNLKALDALLGQKSFLMGESPTEVDCSVFGFLAAIILYPSKHFDEVMGKDYVLREFPKLYEYSMRIKELTYPNFKM